MTTKERAAEFEKLYLKYQRQLEDAIKTFPERSYVRTVLETVRERNQKTWEEGEAVKILG